MIYVIDDDGAIASVLDLILTAEGFSVDVFLTGREAVRQLDRKVPDVVLLDYMLPGENIEKVIARIRDVAGKNLPIILMSAHLGAQKEMQKLSLSDFLAIESRRHKSKKYTVSNNVTPKKPNSSAITAKMLSPATSGRYWNFCKLCPYPLPKNPPEPTASSA